jgi:hypothetical protein
MKEENWVEKLENPNVELWKAYDGKLEWYPETDYELEPYKVIEFVKKIESAAHARGREETIKEIREKIREKIYNPAISPRDSRMPDDPEQAADEAISYMHEKVNEILDTLTEKE